MVDSILFTDQQKQTLLNHAQRYSPNESCAIIYGSIKNEQAAVKDIFLTHNTKESPTSFAIGNKELLTAYKRAERTDTDVIGIFHSHPDSEARPSKTDEQFMQINPVIWIIYSGVQKNLKAYTLNEKICEIQIRYTHQIL